jgi:hypothetical protein
MLYSVLHSKDRAVLSLTDNDLIQLLKFHRIVVDPSLCPVGAVPAAHQRADELSPDSGKAFAALAHALCYRV